MADYSNNHDLEKNALASVFRVLSEQKDINIAHGNDARIMSSSKVCIGTPHYNMTDVKRQQMRGEANDLAFQMRYHDTQIHQEYMPHDPYAGAVFQAMEKARQEIVGGQYKKGVQQNLTSYHEKQLLAKGITQIDYMTALHDDAYQEYMPDAIRLLMRQAAGHDIYRSEYTDKLCQYYRDDYGDKIHEFIKNATFDDQAIFAKECYYLMRDIGMPISDDVFDDPLSDDDDMTNDQDMPEDVPDLQNMSADDGDSDDDIMKSEEIESQRSDISEENIQEYTEQNTHDTSDDDDMLHNGEEAAKPPSRPEHDLTDIPISAFYEIYTTQYDEITDADKLVDTVEQLQQLRQQLDNQMQAYQGIVGKLANRLQRFLLAHQLRTWQFDLEEGILDTARLTRIVTNPLSSLSFKREHEKEFKDTIITLLIDNSGSMRGRPITIAALSADILATTLERCGVKVEVLGFTTKTWKGGKSREHWNNSERKKDPGRITDLRHIIYKSADEPYRRARRKFGLMLQEGLLKENIDGEALLWAYNRLKNRHEDRKILMVISDGAPVDDSTLALNSGNYLERHLRDVINHIENRTDIEVTAIGIGHDVTRYYQKAITIHDVDHLAEVMTQQLSSLFKQKNSKNKAA